MPLKDILAVSNILSILLSIYFVFFQKSTKNWPVFLPIWVIRVSFCVFGIT